MNGRYKVKEPVWTGELDFEQFIIAALNSPAIQKNYNAGGRIGYERLEDARIHSVQ